jgi:molybdopterin synthase sulfur carrier subunit
MRIRAYATLRDLLGTSAIILSLPGRVDIRYVLDRLVEAYPSLGGKLWDADGKWTGFVTVLLNGRSVEWLQGLDTSVADDDALSLFPPVGGG